MHIAKHWALVTPFKRNADGAGASGGASAPVIEAPVVDNGGADADLIDFAAPDIGDIGNVLKNGGDLPKAGSKKKEPEPKNEPETNPEPKKGAKEPKNTDSKGEPAVASLRKAYESLKAEHEELKKTHSAGDPRVKALEAERDSARKDLEDARKRVTEHEERSLLGNPAVRKQLDDMDSEYNSKAGRFYSRTPELDHPTVQRLTQQFARLPFGTPQYKEAFAQFEQIVDEALGGDGVTTHRKLQSTMDWIEETYDFAKRRPQVERDIHSNARKLFTESQTREYTSRRDHISSLIKRAGEVPEEMEKTDPFHPRVVLKQFDSGLSEEQIAKLDANIPEFIHLAINGVAPRSEADYVGMTPEQIQESQARESQRIQMAKDHMVDALHLGMRAARRIPYLIKELAKYKELANKNAQAEPPEPGNGGDSSPSEEDDLQNYKAPDLNKLSFV